MLSLAASETVAPAPPKVRYTDVEARCLDCFRVLPHLQREKHERKDDCQGGDRLSQRSEIGYGHRYSLLWNMPQLTPSERFQNGLLCQTEWAPAILIDDVCYRAAVLCG